jgi:hypothetical protein
MSENTCGNHPEKDNKARVVIVPQHLVLDQHPSGSRRLFGCANLHGLVKGQ